MRPNEWEWVNESERVSGNTSKWLMSESYQPASEWMKMWVCEWQNASERVRASESNRVNMRGSEWEWKQRSEWKFEHMSASEWATTWLREWEQLRTLQLGKRMQIILRARPSTIQKFVMNRSRWVKNVCMFSTRKAGLHLAFAPEQYKQIMNKIRLQNVRRSREQELDINKYKLYYIQKISTRHSQLVSHWPSCRAVPAQWLLPHLCLMSSRHLFSAKFESKFRLKCKTHVVCIKFSHINTSRTRFVVSCWALAPCLLDLLSTAV